MNIVKNIYKNQIDNINAKKLKIRCIRDYKGNKKEIKRKINEV